MTYICQEKRAKNAICRMKEATLLAIVSILLLLTYGCAGLVIGGTRMQDQTCPTWNRPTLVTYINDPKASEWCAAHGAFVQAWSGCTSCQDDGVFRSCTIRLPGAPNEVAPTLLADEVQHVFGCIHVTWLGSKF